jgi:succinate-semialdehyde dehydrogenase/glutarate-semialdehyde dehydrogenase
MRYETINPTTGECTERHATASDTELAQALEQAGTAVAPWSRAPLEARTAVLEQAADLLESEAPDLGRLMAVEMGKPVAEGEAEARKCAWACRYYAGEAPAFLAPSSRESDGSQAWVSLEPIGAVLAIMPWNFPFWQFFRFAAPSLALGNTILLKHSPNTPGCALRIADLLKRAGLPDGVVQNLFLSNEQAAAAMADRRVRGVTLTGSTRAGKQVAAIAGSGLKKMVMELGGSDAFVVFADADLERAAEIGALSRCLNNGQSCIAAKRFLVEERAFETFRDLLVERMDERILGDPMDAAVSLGPLARRDLRDLLAAQVDASIAAGARAVCGGKAPERPGWFYPATILEGISPDSPAACEELFGPVASLFPFRDEEHAMVLANGTDYGLGSSLWTGDAQRALRLIPRLEAGSVFVNGLVKSDPRLPFGGIKDSGFGRELGREAMAEFANLKTTWIA